MRVRRVAFGRVGSTRHGVNRRRSRDPRRTRRRSGRSCATHRRAETRCCDWACWRDGRRGTVTGDGVRAAGTRCPEDTPDYCSSTTASISKLPEILRKVSVCVIAVSTKIGISYQSQLLVEIVTCWAEPTLNCASTTPLVPPQPSPHELREVHATRRHRERKGRSRRRRVEPQHLSLRRVGVGEDGRAATSGRYLCLTVSSRRLSGKR